MCTIYQLFGLILLVSSIHLVFIAFHNSTDYEINQHNSSKYRIRHNSFQESHDKASHHNFSSDDGNVDFIFLGSTILTKLKPNDVYIVQTMFESKTHSNGNKNKNRSLSNHPLMCKISTSKNEVKIIAQNYDIQLYEGSLKVLHILKCLILKKPKHINTLISLEILFQDRLITTLHAPLISSSTGFMFAYPSMISPYNNDIAFHKTYPNPLKDQSTKANSSHRIKSVICATGLDQYPDTHILPLYLEFLQHHLLLGADHIFLAATFHWTSPHMTRLLQIFHSYIDEGSLSIYSFPSSINNNNENDNYSSDNNNKIILSEDDREMFFDACFEFTKDVTDVIGVWDMHDFFIPKYPYMNIEDIFTSFPQDELLLKSKLKSQSSLSSTNCMLSYVPLPSTDVLRTTYVPPAVQPEFRWIGDIFNTTTSTSTATTSIHMTRENDTERFHQNSMYHPGLYVTSLCHDEMISFRSRNNKESNKANITAFKYLFNENSSNTKSFDNISKIIRNNAVLYHFLFDQWDKKRVVVNSDSMAANKDKDTDSDDDVIQNEYSKRFYPQTRVHISQRGLDVLVTLPLLSSRKTPVTDGWIDYNTVYRNAFKNDNNNTTNYKNENINSTEIESELSRGSNNNKIDGNGNGNGNGSINSNNTNVNVDATTYISSLPTISKDFSDVILGSLIERSHDSEVKLTLTTFMICHALLLPEVTQMGPMKVRSDIIPSWKKVIKKFKETNYTKSGQRNNIQKTYCRIKNSIIDINNNDDENDGKGSSDSSSSSSSYVVEGEFVPNILTPDRNSNRRLDILRCKMKLSSPEEYIRYIRANASLHVEIFRGGHAIANGKGKVVPGEEPSYVSIVNFTVPWVYRRTGFMLSLPDIASQYDAWNGLQELTSSTSSPSSASHSDISQSNVPNDKSSSSSVSSSPPQHTNRHRLYICAPGMETPPSPRILPLYLEFVQHHLLLGADHIFLAATFHWTSPHMTRLLQIFHNYIDEGSLSLASQTNDGVDYLQSVEGIYWQRNVVKLIHINVCLYLAKGTADYVGVWDMDEFFIPRRPFTNILDVIRATGAEGARPVASNVNSSDTTQGRQSVLTIAGSGPGQGMADGGGHPLCYLSISSQVMVKSSDEIDDQHLWLGERFPHGAEGFNTKSTQRMGFKKSILPTRTIFQAGLHMAGGCRLPRPFNGCGGEGNKQNEKEEDEEEEFCYTSTATSMKTKLRESDSASKSNVKLFHSFDEVVMDRDFKQVDPFAEGVLYHFYSTHRAYMPVANRPPSNISLSHCNEYTCRFFINVMKHLEARNLVKFVGLPFNLSYLQKALVNITSSEHAIQPF